MAGKRTFEFGVGSGQIANDVTIRNTHYGMTIELEGVYPSDVAELLTADEIAEGVAVGDMIAALVKRHGLGEVVAQLVDVPGAGAQNVLSEIDDYVDDSEIDQWIAKKQPSGE